MLAASDNTCELLGSAGAGGLYSLAIAALGFRRQGYGCSCVWASDQPKPQVFSDASRGCKCGPVLAVKKSCELFL